MIVTMAVLTTMVMPPTLRWALSRLPMRKDEKQRLEREEMEAKGFVPKLERLLLAVDDSNNAKFATRIAGLIAGGSAMPTTVMHIKNDKKTSKAAAGTVKQKAKEVGKTVREFAEQVELRPKARRKNRHQARCDDDRRESAESGSSLRRGRKGLRPDDRRSG